MDTTTGLDEISNPTIPRVFSQDAKVENFWKKSFPKIHSVQTDVVDQFWGKTQLTPNVCLMLQP